MSRPPVRDDALLLTVEDTAALLRVGRSTVYELLGRGELVSISVGRARRVLRRSVEQWLDRQLSQIDTKTSSTLGSTSTPLPLPPRRGAG
jgi:excisionase family DNA binding protein